MISAAIWLWEHVNAAFAAFVRWWADQIGNVWSTPSGVFFVGLMFVMIYMLWGKFESLDQRVVGFDGKPHVRALGFRTWFRVLLTFIFASLYALLLYGIHLLGFL